RRLELDLVGQRAETGSKDDADLRLERRPLPHRRDGLPQLPTERVRRRRHHGSSRNNDESQSRLSGNCSSCAFAAEPPGLPSSGFAADRSCSDPARGSSSRSAPREPASLSAATAPSTAGVIGLTAGNGDGDPMPVAGAAGPAAATGPPSTDSDGAAKPSVPSDSSSFSSAISSVCSSTLSSFSSRSSM